MLQAETHNYVLYVVGINTKHIISNHAFDFFRPQCSLLSVLQSQSCIHNVRGSWECYACDFWIQHRIARGRCKSWTLDSGLDLWSGLWAELWTEIWTENWTYAHFTLPICHSQDLKLLLKWPWPWPSLQNRVAVVMTQFCNPQDMQYACYRSKDHLPYPRALQVLVIWLNSWELVNGWYLQCVRSSSLRPIEVKLCS